MSRPLYRQCWDRHEPIGTIGYPSFEWLTANPGKRPAHMAVTTCGRTECVESANRAIRKLTGHDGVFAPFPGETKRPIGQMDLLAEVTS